MKFPENSQILKIQLIKILHLKNFTTTYNEIIEFSYVMRKYICQSTLRLTQRYTWIVFHQIKLFPLQSHVPYTMTSLIMSRPKFFQILNLLT